MRRAIDSMRSAQQQTVFTASCSLELDINSLCRGVLVTALKAEQERIQAEISKYLPRWVRNVSLAFHDGLLAVQPTVHLSSMRERALFGVDPDLRLRCTFESLLRSSKVVGSTRLLSQYSGGFCSAKAGAARCVSAKAMGAPECDPLGDVLIPDP